MFRGSMPCLLQSYKHRSWDLAGLGHDARSPRECHAVERDQKLIFPSKERSDNERNSPAGSKPSLWPPRGKAESVPAGRRACRLRRPLGFTWDSYDFQDAYELAGELAEEEVGRAGDARRRRSSRARAGSSCQRPDRTVDSGPDATFAILAVWLGVGQTPPANRGLHLYGSASAPR